MKRKLFIIIPAVCLLLGAIFYFFNPFKKAGYIDPGFSEYIAAFTSGRVSVNATIKIELTKDFPDHELNVPVDKKLFSFSPSISGDAFWIDSRTIEFRPAKPMKQCTEYEVTFYLGKVMDVPSKFRKFQYTFETITQAVSVVTDGYEPYNYTSLEFNFVQGKFLTADYADEKAIEEMVTATQNNKKLKITWTHQNENREHHFKIDSVYRGEKASEVKIAWDGSKISSESSGEEIVKIPSIYDFFAIEVRVEHEPEQFVSIRFSDPIDPKQDLKGLVHADNIGDFTFEVNGMEIRAYPATRQNGSAKIILEPGIQNIAHAKLKNSQSFEVLFESIKPAVRLKGKGVILPNSNGLILPFEAVNLKAVDLRIIKIYENNIAHFLQVNQLDGDNELKRAGRLILKKTLSLGSEKPIIFNKWNTFSLDLSKLIAQEPGAIYRIQLSFKQKYSTYPCSSSKSDKDSDDDMTSFDERDIEDFNTEEAKYDNPVSYYDDEYSYDYGDYNWDERDDPCSPSYFYNSEHTVSRNVIASNIGIIAKGNSSNTLHIAVADLLTTKPISGASVDVLNYQNQVIGSGKTDGDGFCTISAKGKPFLIIVKDDKQKGYLKVDDGNALSLSNFDVSGEIITKGLKGFIYGERGVWRPGDTFHLTFMLEDKLNAIPSNHPVILEVINPQGKKYKRITKTNGINGFYTFEFSTSESDITGNYQANIILGSSTFSKTLKIETIKPNRLKINFDFGTDIISERNQTAKLNVKWLHGAPAKNLKTDVKITLTPANTHFAKLEGYVFDDPTKKFTADEHTVYDNSIDENGNAIFNAGLSNSTNAPGMLNANVVTRVFETGGEFSIDRLSILYSPYSSYVGLKSPEGDYHYLETDTNQIFEIATVDPKGNLLNRSNLDFKIYKLDWHWWWSSSDEDLANFNGSSYQTPVFSSNISTINGKCKVPFKLRYPSWGRYLVIVTDMQSGHSTGQVVYFDWPMWRGRSDRGDTQGATMLTFSSDKKSYKVGDKANITVPTPQNSRLLVSLETGSDILKTWWVEATGNETRFSFDIEAGMTPNVYVSVSLIQPHAQVKNDLPIRMYGVIPLTVENPESRLTPVITMPDVIKPEQSTTIKIKEKDGKPMTYTLAIVDDGLLDLTRFKTPDPYNAFNGKEALGIKSWDLYDLVMGSYGGKIEQLFSIGGDNELKNGSGAKAQRFKPVVKFMGPFTLSSGTNSHVFKLPPYIGSVRVMVIAGNKNAFGNAEKTVAVRKPLMVLATLPRVVGPGEEVDLPVTIFAMEKSVRKFNVDISTNELFTILNERNKSQECKEIGEYNLTFRLKVNSKTGIGRVKVTAYSGAEKSTYDIEIQVRNPNPKITKYTEAVINPSASSAINFELFCLPGTSKATLEVSNVPPIDLSRRLEYLISYPYGCAEQTTSKAFPQLYLNKFIELTDNDKKRRDEHINYTIKYIGSLLSPDGGVMYWPNSSSPDDWVTSYCGHFMLEAQNLGYTLPSGFISSWLKYQKKNARNWSYSKTYYYDDFAQAYRLYTLALAKEPEIGAMNRLKEQKNLSVQSLWRLAAAYVLIGRDDEAKKLINTALPDNKDYHRFNFTYGSDERDIAMMLETLCLLKDKTKAYPLVKKISGALSGNYWLSTQTTAYCLLSLSKFLDIAQFANELKFSYQLPGGSVTQVYTHMPISQIKLPVSAIGNYNVSLHNFTKGSLFSRVIVEGVPETNPTQAFENNVKLSVIYQNENGSTLDVSELKQGTDFKALVTVTNSYPNYELTNMALSQIFPSGWEITNTRFLGNSDDNYSSCTYQDFRDDRVNTFFNLSVNSTKTFVIKLTAAYTGRFYLPGVLCEAMYEPGVNAFVPGKWIEVVK
jgi:alpha-2-macroglobulin